MSDASRATERIEAALAKLDGDREPPAGWEDRVLAAIAQPSRDDARAHTTEAPIRRRWWWFALPALAVAVIAIIVLRPAPPPPPLAIGFNVLPNPNRVRGSYGVDDRVQLSVTGGGPHRALWVYRGERHLVLACPGDARCTGDGAISAELKLDTVGMYTIVALSSPSPIAPPTGSYDDDLAAARSAGCSDKTQALDVR